MQRHRGTTELERKKNFFYALKIADNSLVAKLLITLIVLFFWAAINEFAVFVFFFFHLKNICILIGFPRLLAFKKFEIILFCTI